MEDNSQEPGALATDAVVVRNMVESDLDAIVRIDAAAMGRARRDYYRDRVAAAMRDSRIHASLTAELDGMIVGFLMATLYYGEFGRPEPTAVIDSLGVLPGFKGKHVGRALMRQFLMNASALGVERVRTEVAWDDTELLGFFKRSGFALAGRLVLERTTETPR